MICEHGESVWSIASHAAMRPTADLSMTLVTEPLLEAIQ